MSKRQKRAFITGITGQDGAYLAVLLSKKGYKIFGLVRSIDKNSLINIDKLIKKNKVNLIKGDLTNKKSIIQALQIANPDEIYNLAAQASDINSESIEKETYNINCKGFGYLVKEAMKINPKIRIFQAGTSLMFDQNSTPPQNEQTPLIPCRAYGKSKLEAHNKYVLGYRKKYKLYICTGILFNHESPLRKEGFVTRKITKSMVKIKLGLLDSLRLGNIDIRRDWGYVGDYVEAMCKMLQQKEPTDLVVATGETHSVREFVEEACNVLDIDIIWKGKGVHEKGIDKKTGKVIVEVDKDYFRPNEVNYLCGDNSKAKKVLGWKPKCKFKDLVKIMVEADLKQMKNILDN